MWRSFSSWFIAKKGWMVLALPAWVIGSFVLVQVIVGIVVGFLGFVGVDFSGINRSVLNTLLSAVIYVLTLVMVIGLPWRIKKYQTTKKDLGLDRPPSWLDILLGPVGFGIYVLLSAALIVISTHLLPFIDWDQIQNTGFSQPTDGIEYVLAFLTLVIIAPIAEEVLFRGYLLGKLSGYVPVWAAVLITSLLFALAHGMWNVGVDVFALSIVLCVLRVATKSLWPSILVHMIKNGLAYYLLFINPTLLGTLG